MTSFSEKLSDGISLSGNDVSIRLVPVQPVLQPGQSLIATAEAIAQRLDSKTVEYRYDAKTTIEYSLTYTGFKEDIVVSEYTGQTEYHFFLYTGGLSLTQIDGSYFLTDEDGTIKASIGDIIVFTADERNNTFGRLESAIIKDKQIYLLTIVLDAEYLSDPNTAYPIRIDPEIRIDHELYGSAAIEDVTLHSAGTSYPRYTVLTVGTSEKGKSRLLLRIPKINGYDFSQLSGATVTSAWINLRDIMCESTSMNVTCYPYTGEAWEEDTAQWGDLAQDWGEALDSYAISYSNGLNQPIDHWYRFHIESLVQAWIDGEADQNQGVIFKADDSVESGNTLLYKTFGSYELSAYKPSFVLNYVLDMTLNYDAKDINEGDSFTLIASTAEGPVTDTNIIWLSSNPAIATVSQTGVVTGIKAGTVTICATTADAVAPAYCTVYVTVEDGVYYIQNVNSGYYLNVGNGKIENFSDVNQFLQAPPLSDDIYKIHQMWKITHLGNGRYSVRPMNKLNMGLDVTGNNVDIYNIGVSDTLSSVPSYGEWTIEWYPSGYVFKNNGNDSLIMQIKDDSTLLLISVVASTYSQSLSCRWELSKVTSPPVGAYLYDTAKEAIVTTATRAVDVGTTKSLSTLQLSAVAYSGTNISQSFTWYSSNNAIATVDSNGAVTGVSSGKATITGYVYRNSAYHYVSYTICVGFSFESTMTKLNELYDVALEYDNTPRNAALLTMQFIRRMKYNGGSL